MIVRISAELLRLLSPVRQVRDQVRALDGLPIVLSLLHGQHLKLLWSLAWVLVQLCEDPPTRAEIRSWGGVQQLLWLLNRWGGGGGCGGELHSGPSTMEPGIFERIIW